MDIEDAHIGRRVREVRAWRNLSLSADLLATARRDVGGRELRGLAWRMGIAPIG